MTRLLALAALLAFALPASAGKYNKTLKVGQPAPFYAGLPGTDRKVHGMADLKDKDVIVVVFTCPSCTVAQEYEDRLVAFAAAHAGKDSKVAVVAINPNTGPEDDMLKMDERVSKKKYPFLYLLDPTQEIARKYGANYTPEFFVLDKERKVVYMGALDDKPPPAEPGAKYVEDAVAAALAGKPAAVGETLARGCRVRYVAKKDE